MRLADAVVKHSAGRLTIQHLTSHFHVRVNERALVAIADALSSPGVPSDGAPLVERLAAQGLVEPGEPAPFERRAASDVISVELEPAGTCNLACGHCFVDFSGRRMSEAVFEAALSGAVALGAVEMSFNGGEPLLHPRLLDFVDRARAARLRVQLFTNATRVTDEVADRLAAARLAKVAISVDGLEESHDALRGPGTFAQTVAGLRRLTARRVPVQVTIAVHPGNAGEAEATTRRALDEWGVRWVRLSTIAPLGRARERLDLLPDDALFARHQEPPACAATPVAGGLPCLAGIDKLFVGADGAVHGCHLFDTGTPLGRLPERSLEDIWRRPEGPVAAVLRDFGTASLGGCAGCDALAACRGGCRARAFRLSGRLDAPDPIACRGRGAVPARLG